MTPWTVARQVPLSMEILQARILEGVVVSFSRGSSRPSGSPALAGRFFTTEQLGEGNVNMEKTDKHYLIHVDYLMAVINMLLICTLENMV